LQNDHRQGWCKPLVHSWLHFYEGLGCGDSRSKASGVWVGNDDNTKNNNVTGGTVPALIWKDIMISATARYGASDFDYPNIELKNYSGAKQGDDENAEKPKDDNTNITTDENVTTDDGTSPDNQNPDNTLVEPQYSKPASTKPAYGKQNSAKSEKRSTLAPIPMATPAGIGRE